METVNNQQIEQQLEVQHEIQKLEGQNKWLESQLKVPQNVRGLVGGFMAGLAMTKSPLGGIGLGYLLHQNAKELTPEKKQYIQSLIQANNEKIRELKGENVSEGILSGQELNDLKFPVYNFDGSPWFDLVGNPSKNFHAIVFGKPKSGKSIFCMRFAEYLSNYGKVLYIAAEERFGHTLKDKVQQWANGGNANMDFGSFTGYESIKKNIAGYDFVVIDSVNYAHITVDEVEDLKKANPKMALVTVLQATKGGDFRGSQEYAHNCDIVIEVVEGVAHQKGRFQAASAMPVFEK